MLWIIKVAEEAWGSYDTSSKNSDHIKCSPRESAVIKTIPHLPRSEMGAIFGKRSWFLSNIMPWSNIIVSKYLLQCPLQKNSSQLKIPNKFSPTELNSNFDRVNFIRINFLGVWQYSQELVTQKPEIWLTKGQQVSRVEQAA